MSTAEQILEVVRRSEEQLRVATLAAEIGVWSWIPGTSEVIVSANWRRLFGIAPETVVTFETWCNALHPDDRDRAVGELESASERCHDFNSEYRVVWPDGTVRWLVDRGRASYDANGRAIGMAGVNVDITERKRAEEALRESEVRFQAFMDNSPAVAWMKDEDGRYVYVNKRHEERFGIRSEDWSGKTDLELWPREVAEQFRSNDRDVLASGQTMEVIEQTSDREGRRSDWWSFKFTFQGAGGTRYVGGIGIDITERKQMEDALREADRRKNEFLSMLSHELRNPLAPIRNSLYLLERAAPGSDEAARAREVIHRQTDHLARLVDDLIDVTRISRGKIELKREHVDAREVVRRTCEDHRTIFDQRGIELRAEIALPAWIDADATRVSQAIGNLLQNAAKFTRPGGVVTVSVGAVEGRAEVRVRDDGIGIAPDLLPRVFDPFFQAQHDLARTQGGLGLGLALVRALVELHGGSVSAQSEGPDRGSEFVVWLPLAADPQLAHGEPRARPDGSPRVVLVIEDYVDSGQTLADVLTLQGHSAHLATDGASGLRKARELRPDVVLCDIGLPDVDGYEVARTLRRDDELRSTYLVALSGYAQPEDRRRAVEAGFDAHLTKPADLEELARVVAEAPPQSR
jgi:PAS domain S-box-containing protein